MARRVKALSIRALHFAPFRTGGKQAKPSSVETEFDYLFAGGGLSAGLCALRLGAAQPSARIGIVERDSHLGGNHTWSFHDSDVSASQRRWLAPLISHHWDGQAVRFPKRTRTLETGYNSIFAEQFDRVLKADGRFTVIHGEVASLSAEQTTLTNGDTLTSPCIFDARGPIPSPHMEIAFQKFLGREVRFAQPHGLTEPIIMDATVPQTDGYRFVYVLPFTEDTALIEDTYYADGHALSEDELRAEIDAYAARQGWQIAEALRDERGVLPITLSGDVDAYWASLPSNIAPLGLRAGLFHPVTGYSVSEAARLADKIAEAAPKTTKEARAMIETHAKARWANHGFYRLLNRMLFKAAEPEARYIVLERFYGLPESLIQRFYAGDNSAGDKARILAGKPPVPLGRAIKAMFETSAREPVNEGVLG